jgi:hypothetical protein
MTGPRSPLIGPASARMAFRAARTAFRRSGERGRWHPAPPRNADDRAAGPSRRPGAGGPVIGKVCPRGQDVAGLIRYLYGPGRREVL